MNRPATASQSLGGTNADSVLRKLFFGERISQNTRLIFFEFGSRKRRRRGLGMNPPLAPLISFGEIRAGNYFKLSRYVLTSFEYWLINCIEIITPKLSASSELTMD